MENPEKTVANNSSLQPLFDVLSYVSRPTATERGEYVSAINCLKEIIMDFFSGSATTAHAVMQLNAEDGGHRKSIMVQLPEDLDEAIGRASDAKTKNSIKKAIKFLVLHFSYKKGCQSHCRKSAELYNHH